MPSRLLTLMRKRGAAFSPLSLNPTLWALPANSYSRTGAQFTAASSQYLSVASPTGIVDSSSDFLVCGWFKLDSTGTFLVLVASSQENITGINWIIGTNNATPAVPYFSILNSSNSVIAQALSPTTIATGTWYFFTAYHDSSAKQLGMSINAGSFGTATYSGTPKDASYPINLGSYSDSNYYNGAMDNILYMAGAGIADLASTIATTLYNSGNGFPFQDITAQQQSDWGIVSGWLDNSLTADAFGSNTLTNNNGVTQAAGKVNAVAVDNDPTYFVNDASSSDNDLSQVTLASRPIYKTADGGYWTLDGANDSMTGAWSISSASKIASFVVFDPINAATNQIVVSSQGPAVQYQILNSAKYFYAGNNTYGFGTNANGDKHIALSVFDGTQTGNANRLKGYINGGSNIITNFVGTVPSTLTSSTMQVSLGAAPANGNLYHWSVFENLTIDQINAIGQYLADTHGLTWTDI